MRVSGVLITVGIVLVALSGLVEGAAVVRWLQGEQQLLVPMPCEQSLPIMVGSRLRLEAFTDGLDRPMAVVVQWNARDGNGILLNQGETAVLPGHTTALGIVPAGNRRELHLSARVVLGSPHQAWLQVRPDAIGAATLALSGIALFVVGELALGLGTALSVWRLFWRFAKPIKDWWSRWQKSLGGRKKAKRRPKTEMHVQEDLETKPDMAPQTDTQAETAIPNEETEPDVETELDALAPKPPGRAAADDAERETVGPRPAQGAPSRSASTSISHEAVEPEDQPPSTTRRRKRPRA